MRKRKGSSGCSVQTHCCVSQAQVTSSLLGAPPISFLPLLFKNSCSYHLPIVQILNPNTEDEITFSPVGNTRCGRRLPGQPRRTPALQGSGSSTFPRKDHLTKTSARAVAVPPLTTVTTNAFNTFKIVN